MAQFVPRMLSFGLKPRFDSSVLLLLGCVTCLNRHWFRHNGSVCPVWFVFACDEEIKWCITVLLHVMLKDQRGLVVFFSHTHTQPGPSSTVSSLHGSRVGLEQPPEETYESVAAPAGLLETDRTELDMVF